MSRVAVSSRRKSVNQHSMSVQKSLQAQNAAQSITSGDRSSNFSTSTTDYYHSVSDVRPAEKSLRAQTVASLSRMSQNQSYSNFSTTTDSYYSISQLRPTEKSITAQTASSENQSYSKFSTSSTTDSYGNQHSNYSAQTKNSHHSVSDIRPPEKSLMAQAASSSISMSRNKSSSNVQKSTTDSSYSISKVHPIERSVMAQTAASSIRSEIQPYPNFAESTTGSYYSISDVRPTERSRVAQAADSSIGSDHQSYSGFSASATYSISQVRPKEKSQIAAMPISMSLNQLYSNSTTSNRVDSISDIRRMEKSVGARAAATYESHSKISKSTSKSARSKKSS